MPAKKTHENYVKKMEQLHQNIEIIGKYINSATKVDVKCKIDGYMWQAAPNHSLSGRGCPKCYATSLTKTHEQFFEQVKEMHPDIEVIGKYINARTDIELKCKIDGHVWKTQAKNTLEGYGCPKCARKDRNKIHGLARHPLYKRYQHMISRCYDPKANNYHNYGGRGVVVCKRWLDKQSGVANYIEDVYQSYLQWKLDNPNDVPELDKDLSGGLIYSKETTQWVSKLINRQNSRNTRLVSLDNKIMSEHEASLTLGKYYSYLSHIRAKEQPIPNELKDRLFYI